MNHDVTLSNDDYKRLRRALIGFMLLILVQIITGFVVQYDGSNPIADGLFCLLYCSIPAIGIVAICRSPFPPEDDAAQQRYLKAAINGRRGCFWFGVACVVTGLLAFPLMDRQFPGFSAWFILCGLAFVLWSFWFPKVQLPEDARRWQFSLRTLLVVTLVVGLYMGAVVLYSEPDDSLVWRLFKPLLAVGALCFLISLFVVFVVTPIRVVWAVAVKLFGGQKAKVESETS